MGKNKHLRYNQIVVSAKANKQIQYQNFVFVLINHNLVLKVSIIFGKFLEADSNNISSLFCKKNIFF